MASVYPNLNGLNKHAVTIEGFLKANTQQFDIVFTMAVLVHIHPETIQMVMDGISAIAKEYIVLIEFDAENLDSSVCWYRDYQTEFTKRGWKLKDRLQISTSIDKQLDCFTLFVFKRES